MFSNKSRFHIVVKGRVQGVCFRYYTQIKANSLGLKGYVRNLPNGSSVEIVAEGDEASLEALLEWSRQGPPSAKVMDITFQKENYMDEFSNFDVRY